MKKEFKTESADQFKVDEDYIFPFEVLDKDYGRIEWHIEPVKGRKTKGRYYIEKLYVWATQTKDEKYRLNDGNDRRSRVFEIPCYSESITEDSINREGYLNHVWRVMFCELHNSMVFSGYPANHHKKLIIRPFSFISIDIDFE